MKNASKFVASIADGSAESALRSRTVGQRRLCLVCDNALLSGTGMLLMSLVLLPGLVLSDELKLSEMSSSSSVLADSGGEEGEDIYSGILTALRGNGTGRGHGLFVRFRVFEIGLDTAGRDDMRVVSFGLVEPFTRLGVGTTLFERNRYANRLPLMNIPDSRKDEYMDIASWFPLELHFVPFTYGLPGFPKNRFFRHFLGSADIYFRYSNWANFRFHDDFFSVYHFGASYIDTGLGFETPFVSVRLGLHSYRIPASSDGNLSVLAPYNGTFVYASACFGIQTLFGRWAPRKSKLGFPSWFGFGESSK